MKMSLQLAHLSVKQITRQHLRSILTMLGVAAGIFLFTAVETLQHALGKATAETASDTTLVVYRENRFCPATSRLPEHYLPEISRIEGVEEVIPIQIAVNNCGASLDVIAFRGVPVGSLREFNPELEVVDGSYDTWMSRSDAALVGRHFAAKRGLRPGDQFEAVGVRVYVAGIVVSPHPQDNNVAYVHLPFLQQSTRVGLGVVTQFNVRVSHPDYLERVADQIDAVFAADTAPTDTRPEKAFFAQTAQDMIELIEFTRWLGFGAVLAVMGLVGNALLLVARSRVKEGAILQTIGYSRFHIGLLMIWEGTILGLLGGFLGAAGATLFFHFKRFTLGNEGLTMAITPSLEVASLAMLIAAGLGLLASLWPAYLTASKPLVGSLRSA